MKRRANILIAIQCGLVKPIENFTAGENTERISGEAQRFATTVSALLKCIYLCHFLCG